MARAINKSVKHKKWRLILFILENICKGFGVLSFGKNLSGKYSQKHLHHAKQSATDARKTHSNRIKKTNNQKKKNVEGTDDLTGDKITNKFTGASRTST